MKMSESDRTDATLPDAIDAVFVDVYGVIERPVRTSGREPVEWCSSIVSEFLADRGQPEPAERVFGAFSRVQSFLGDVAPNLPWPLHIVAWRLALEELGIDARAEVVDELFRRACARREAAQPIYEDARPGILMLRKQFKVGILSNGNAYRIRHLLEGSGLRGLADEVLVSGEWQLSKPAFEMFDFMARRLRVKMSRCLMVGDRLDTDINGAIEKGMSAILLDRSSRTEVRGNNGHSGSFPVVRDLVVLAKYLTQSEQLDFPVPTAE